jgi:hypothetical protein
MKMQMKRYSRAIHECVRDRIRLFKPWIWSALSHNPNITYDIVKEKSKYAMELVVSKL